MKILKGRGPSGTPPVVSARHGARADVRMYGARLSIRLVLTQDQPFGVGGAFTPEEPTQGHHTGEDVGERQREHRG